MQALADFAVRASDGGSEGVYLLSNPLALPVTNRLKKFGKGKGAKNDDITRRRVLIVDVDPERPKEKLPNGDEVRANATDAEKALALECAHNVAAFLRERGLPEPILADSGNGFHLLYLIDLPPESSLVRDVIYLLAERFSDDAVKIDKAVHNAGRIWKLYGTAVRKGPHSNERPHRLSRIISVPEGGPERVPEERIQALLGIVEAETESARAFSTAEEEAAHVLGFITYRPEYIDWLKIAWGVVDKVGDVDTAIRLLKEWRPEEVRGEYEKKLRHDTPLEHITFGSVIYYARQGGYVPPRHSKRDERKKPPAQDDPSAAALPQRAYDLLPRLLRQGCVFFDAWYERDLFLTGALGTLSNVLANVRFRYGKTYHSAHLFLFGIGRAGRGKDAMRQGFRLCEKIVEAKHTEYVQQLTEWEERKRAYDNFQRKSKRDQTGEDPPEAPGPKPPEALFKVGEDITLPALFQALTDNPEGLLIATTEADAISGAMRREHGGFGPLLRACFHHEAAQKTLKGEGNLYVQHPRLALCISGTRDQYMPLIESVENGLQSRFGTYRSQAPLQYRSQLDASKDLGFENYLTEAQQQVLTLYNTLFGREEPLYFDVPTPLWQSMDATFKGLFNRLFVEHTAPDALAANVYRGTLIGFRIAMILSTLRHYEQGADLSRAKGLEASPEDIKAARLVALVYVEHSLRQALELAPELGLLPDLSDVGDAHRMTGDQRAFFDALPASFTRAEAKTIWKKQGKPDSTGGYWLKRFVKEGLLRQPRTGQYAKASALESLECLESVGNQPENDGFSLETVLESSLESMEAVSKGSNSFQPTFQSETGLDDTKNGPFPKIPNIPTGYDALIDFDDDEEPS